MNHRQVSIVTALVIGSLAGCASQSDPGPDLAHRAYIISRESDDLTVIDLDKLEIIGVVHTAGLQNHMGELSADLSKIYVDSSETDQTIVVDTRTLSVTGHIATGSHPTHVSLSRDGSMLAVMNEYGNSVTFIDPVTDTEISRLPGFFTPHFMRFSPDGAYGYVANIGAFHLTRVDLKTRQIVDHIPLEGAEGPPNETLAPNETGFADAQIDQDGVLYAAHNATSRVLVYDTVAQRKIAERAVGAHPWIVYAEHPFAELPRRHLVPAFGDRTVSMVHTDDPITTIDAGDMEAFGVNYSPLVPDKAFVMNRLNENIRVVDTANGTVTGTIPTGGNTETASTTADGKWIVAAVSSSNQVIVIDAKTNAIVKTFDHVGVYPWSVTIPFGQNYCH